MPCIGLGLGIRIRDQSMTGGAALPCSAECSCDLMQRDPALLC